MQPTQPETLAALLSAIEDSLTGLVENVKRMGVALQEEPLTEGQIAAGTRRLMDRFFLLGEEVTRADAERIAQLAAEDSPPAAQVPAWGDWQDPPQGAVLTIGGVQYPGATWQIRLPIETGPPAAPETPQAPAEGADGGLVRNGGSDAGEGRTVAEEQGPWEVWADSHENGQAVYCTDGNYWARRSQLPAGVQRMRFTVRERAECVSKQERTTMGLWVRYVADVAGAPGDGTWEVWGHSHDGDQAVLLNDGSTYPRRSTSPVGNMRAVFYDRKDAEFAAQGVAKQYGWAWRVVEAAP